MFSKFSVLPTVSKYLKGSKRLLHMSKKFAGAFGTNYQNYTHYSLNFQDDQPICSGSRYSLNGSATMQVRLMSSRDSKDGDFDKSIENTRGLKAQNEDSKNDVKVIKKVVRRKSRKESRESYKNGDRFKFSSKRRRNQRELTVLPTMIKAENKMALDFPHKQVADLLKNNPEHKTIDIVKNTGISQSALPPKKLHIEYVESINLKDIELKKIPPSSRENFKRNPTPRGIKRNLKLSSEATQLTNLYLESKNRVPVQIEKENLQESSQSGNETDEPNFRVIVNLDSISPMGNQSNLKPSGSNDTKASPKDTPAKTPVIDKTFKKQIQILPLNTGHKLNTPQKTENVDKTKSIDNYKPMGLRYTKFSKLMDRVATWNIKSLKSTENLRTSHTTPQKKPKIEKLKFSEMFKPTSLNVTAVSADDNADKKTPPSMIQEVTSAKNPTNATTLQNQANIDIFKLPEKYTTTSFENAVDSTQIKNEPPLPVAQELKTNNSHSTKSNLKGKSNSDGLKLSEIFKSTSSIDEAFQAVAETKDVLIPIVKDVNSKSEVEPSKVFDKKKLKELNRRYKKTPYKENEMKLDSEVKTTANPDTKLFNADSAKSLNTSVNSVDTKLEIPPNPTYTNVKAKIEQANNEIRLESTKPILTEPLPRTTISNKPVKNTKSGVFKFKTKTSHSKHYSHEESIRKKPKFISKYKRAEMFKKATEKILGRLESPKSKIEQKVNDLKTAAYENLSGIQDNTATEQPLQFNIQSPKDVKFKNTHDKASFTNLKLKNPELGPGEKDTTPNILLDTRKTEPKTLSANKGEYKLLPKLDTDILKVKKVPKVLENDIKIAKGSSTTNVGNISSPSVDTLKPKTSPPSNKNNEYLNMAKNKNMVKTEQGSISPPSMDILKAKYSPPPNKNNQSLKMANKENFKNSEQVAKKADVWTTLPRPQDNSKKLTNSAVNNPDSNLKQLKVQKPNVDSALPNLKTFSKSDKINFSTTNITSTSKLVEPMKQPLADMGSEETDKRNKPLRKSPSNTTTNRSSIGENPPKSVTSFPTDKHRASTLPSHYPKNMFGEIISPEQLRKSQEKLKTFQANLDVTAARPSIKTAESQNMSTGNAKKPNNVSRPGPSKKPVSDGGSGNQGGGNSGSSESIHDTEGHFANFWSTTTITTMYLALSIMIYLMKELQPLYPWQRLFTSLTREQTEAILRIHPATYEKATTNSDLQDDAGKDLLQENIVTGCIGNEDQNNSNDLEDSKIVKVDKNSKFEDV